MEVAAGLMGPLLCKLGELVDDEFNLDKPLKLGIKSLEMELALMHATLLKVDELPPDMLDTEVKIWTGKVKEMSYKLEDAVDSFMVCMEEGHDNKPTSMKNRVKKILKKTIKLFSKGKALHQISNAIQEAQDLAKELAEQHNRYKLEKHSTSYSARIDPRLIDMYKDVTELVGIEEASDELIQMLTEGDEGSKLQRKTISIVGFGGLGKTTLAKTVYDRIKVQFNCGAFVWVSHTTDMKNVLKDMMYGLDKAKFNDIHSTMRDEHLLIRELREFLEDKRYLVVIDDLWDENVWTFISNSLPSNGYGSRLITTTRVNSIAEKCCSGQKDLIYEIMPLGYHNSKRLFQRYFGFQDNCHDALTEVDEILKICGGMPLAIISIASLLFSRNVKDTFQKMIKCLHSGRLDLPSMDRLTNILSYSYFDLPSTLKPCLLYLAASAKNQRIHKDNLVRKWIAEGLIPEAKDRSRVEVASRYFDELINRNVIHPVEYGNRTYEVNYMMLYALRLIAREENFATILSDFDTSEAYVDVMPIRLFIQCSDSERSIGTERMNLTNARSITTLGPAKSVSLKYLKYVRVLDLDGSEDLDNSAMDDICRMILLTYLSLNQTKVTEIPPQISDLRYLKTLAIRNTPITTLPLQIGELQNLETLDVRQTQISNLPPEIRKLQNLETLDVRQTQVKELPKEVIQVPKLSHLHFGQSGSLGVKLPVGSDQLKSVKVMGTVDSRVCSESAMKEISELIEVRELEVVLYDEPADREQNDKLLSCVGKCCKLQSLTIYGDSNPSDKLPPPPPNFPLLEMLKVAGRFVKVPQWIALLKDLKKLDIRVCILEPNDLGILAELPRLSSLALALVALPREQVAITGSTAGFARLEAFSFNCRVPWITFEQGAMPSLKHLDLKLYVCSPGKFPSGIMYLPSLKKIILRHSSQYASSVGVTETVAVMKKEAASHANLIELTINGNREIFPSNTSISGTEIEE